MTSEKVFAVCAACGLNRQTKRNKLGKLLPPKGWKRRDGADGEDVFTCPACWRSLYRLRAIVIPVQGVQGGGSWAEFCQAVRRSLLRSRTLAQWTINKLAATDVVRNFNDDKPPKHPPLGHASSVYLYGIGPEYPGWGDWAGNYKSAECVMRLMEAKYNAKRYCIIWEANASVPTIRSCPYPIASQNWRASYIDHASEETGQLTKVPAVTFPLDGTRWTLRLRGGARRVRQLSAFRSIATGEAVQCEMQVYRKKSQENRNRNGDSERRGGRKERWDIVVKLVAWLPKQQRDRKREGTLSVHSSKQAMLVAVHPDFERPWILNRHDIPRRVYSHAARLQRISEDTKCEVRPLANPRGPWKKLTEAERKERRHYKRSRKRRLHLLDDLARRYNNYMDTAVKTAAAWLANYADRIGVAAIHLDLSETGWCPGFRWAALRERLCGLCEDLAPPIRVEIGSAEENNGGDAAEGTSPG